MNRITRLTAATQIGNSSTTILKNETLTSITAASAKPIDLEPARQNRRAVRDRRDDDHEHRRHPHAVDVEERVRQGTGELDGVRARHRRPLELGRDERRAGSGRGREQHRHEEQAATQEHGCEELVLVGADMSPDHGDEPKEGDAGKRRQVEADEREVPRVHAEIPIRKLRRSATGRRRAPEQQQRRDHQHREREARDTGSARRLRGPAARLTPPRSRGCQRAIGGYR